MMERGIVSAGRHRRKNRKKRYVARFLLLMFLVIVGMGIYAAAKSVISNDITTGSDLIVTEVVAFGASAQEKKIPQQYNGFTHKVVYLTFDDGPNQYTEQMLNILKERNIQATYFMLGDNMRQFSHIVKRIAEEGHYPGLHSMTHNFNKLYKSGSSKNFIDEFQEAQSIVKELVGVEPTLIRAPYGSAPQIGQSFRDDIVNATFKLWDWTLDSLDWRFSGQPQRILEQIQAHLSKDVEVILLHDRQQTLAALPAILDFIESKGYEFEVYNPHIHFMCNFHDDKRL